MEKPDLTALFKLPVWSVEEPNQFFRAKKSISEILERGWEFILQTIPARDKTIFSEEDLFSFARFFFLSCAKNIEKTLGPDAIIWYFVAINKWRRTDSFHAQGILYYPGVGHIFRNNVKFWCQKSPWKPKWRLATFQWHLETKITFQMHHDFFRSRSVISCKGNIF
jgi:hypothetical protein